MKLTVLGKYGPYPSIDGANSGYLLQANGANILLDMGAGVFSRLLKGGHFNTLSAIYLSHLHFDHTSDMLPLRYYLEAKGQRIHVFAPLDDSPWCNTLFLPCDPVFIVENLCAQPKIFMGGMLCDIKHTKHPVPNFAVKIREKGKVFVYTGDTADDPSLPQFLQDADFVLGDFSKPNDFVGGHMRMADTVRLQQSLATGTKKPPFFLASHITPGDHPEAFFEGYPNIAVAEEGKTYEI